MGARLTRMSWLLLGLTLLSLGCTGDPRAGAGDPIATSSMDARYAEATAPADSQAPPTRDGMMSPPGSMMPPGARSPNGAAGPTPVPTSTPMDMENEAPDAAMGASDDTGDDPPGDGMTGRGGDGDSDADGQAPAAGMGGTDPPPAPFTPCPTGQTCRILPLGDSITYGLGSSGGYRVELFRRALEDGKDITFVGGSMNGPDTVGNAPFPRSHEGHSGWTIAQLDGIVPDPALAPNPHIVLLHIGTNDMYQSPSGAPDRLDALIGQITGALPDALLVVATIIPFAGAAASVNSFNAAIPGLVEAHAAAGEHVIMVDQFKDFPTSELGDGVHPNRAGYERMAGVWYAAIRDRL